MRREFHVRFWEGAGVRFPRATRLAHLVRQLEMLCPTLGKVRIARMLARAGLYLSASTVGRVPRRSTRHMGSSLAETKAIG